MGTYLRKIDFILNSKRNVLVRLGKLFICTPLIFPNLDNFCQSQMTSMTFFFLHLLSFLCIISKVSDGQQQMQHYKLLMQVLNKRHLNHIESFKKALKLHSEHVQQRQKRVGKDMRLTNYIFYRIIYRSKPEL